MSRWQKHGGICQIVSAQIRPKRAKLQIKKGTDPVSLSDDLVFQAMVFRQGGLVMRLATNMTCNRDRNDASERERRHISQRAGA
ncbi:MAG: hypothetical protein K1X74_01675 [Pirellulales bacterium]|nr:hypothetical protein [Pirellulales bacterium]